MFLDDWPRDDALAWPQPKFRWTSARVESLRQSEIRDRLIQLRGRRRFRTACPADADYFAGGWR